MNASRLAVARAVGTTLGWYDFTIHNTLAALIFNGSFFPSFHPTTRGRCRLRLSWRQVRAEIHARPDALPHGVHDGRAWM